MTITITVRHAKSESVYTTIKRVDGIASTMKTIEIGITKLDELKTPLFIQATFCNGLSGRVEVYLANQQDADLFLSAFEGFENYSQQRKAESVGKGGISSDDVIEKLTIKLGKAIILQNDMKFINKSIRKHKDKENAAELIANETNIGQVRAAELLVPDFAGRIGFPSYQITNNAATIRNTKKRIVELEAHWG